MGLAVLLWQRVTQQILAVKFVGDTGERGAEILAEADFRVPAAGLFGAVLFMLKRGIGVRA